MIKIIKEGRKPKKMRTIYIITCPDCGCEFECELSDFKRIERTLNGSKYIDCPCCGKEIDTASLKHIETREEEIIEPIPIIPPFNPNLDPFNPNLDSDSWRDPGYSDPQVPSKDPCKTCPNRFGPKDIFGHPTVGDSPCQWCPYYKWRIVYCSDGSKTSTTNLNQPPLVSDEEENK